MSSSTTETSTIDVEMPQMGVSVVEGTVLAWCKAVGDAVVADEIVCEITTDKIDTEIPAPASGTLSAILVEVGDTVDAGTVIARIEATGPAPARRAGAPGATGGTDDTAEATSTTGHDDRRSRSRFYSPVARRIADEFGVDISRIEGSGRNQRVTKADVLAFVEASNGSAGTSERPLHSDSPYQAAVEREAAQPAPDDLGGVPVPLSRMRRSIGAAMLRSQEVTATCTTVVECDFSLVEERRRALGVTALPIVAAVTIATLHEFPELNATLSDDILTTYERVHLGIAVSLGADGLIVPVIHDAQNLSIEGLAERIRDVAARARAKKLIADDVRGATITITNPGAFGALLATPIIDVPQVAILDLEAIVRRPVVITDANGSEAIAIRSMGYLCMSWDHRAIDGGYAAQFLTALRLQLEGRAPPRSKTA